MQHMEAVLITLSRLTISFSEYYSFSVDFVDLNDRGNRTLSDLRKL